MGHGFTARDPVIGQALELLNIKFCEECIPVFRILRDPTDIINAVAVQQFADQSG